MSQLRDPTRDPGYSPVVLYRRLLPERRLSVGEGRDRVAVAGQNILRSDSKGVAREVAAPGEVGDDLVAASMGAGDEAARSIWDLSRRTLSVCATPAHGRALITPR